MKRLFGTHHSFRQRLPAPRDVMLVLAGLVIALGLIGVTQLIASRRVALPYQPGGVTAPWIPPTVKQWDSQITTIGQKYDIDPNLIAIIMTLESGGDARATSPDNALGLMQVTPGTAGDIASRYLKRPRTTYNLLDPNTNIEFGVAYLAYLRHYFGTAKQGPDWNETVELVAAGYNGGPGAAGRLQAGKGLTDTQTVVYSRDAFNMWRERASHDSPTFDRWKERGGSSLLNAAKTSQQH